MAKSPTFEVIAGTYEEYLIGYNFISKDSELIQSFAAHDHSASVRSVAFEGHYLASGAADDRILIYDLKTRKEQCMLTHHNSTITALAFTSNHSHLLSSSSDGNLCVVRVGNWQLEKVFPKAHKGAAVTDIALHPSGKLALTLGADYSLRTWNLIKGRQAYVINLLSKSKDPRSLEKIKWAQDGVRFILYGGRYTEVWSIETGGILSVIEHDQKVSCCTWLTKDSLVVGYEDGKLAIVEIETCNKSTCSGHDGRVKAIEIFEKWVVTASSQGIIKIWTQDLKELAKFDTGCRITCLCLASPVKVKKEETTNMEMSESDAKLAKNLNKSRSVLVEVEGSDDDDVIEIVSNNNKQVSDKANAKRKHEFIVEEQEVNNVQKKKMKSKTKQNSVQKGKISKETNRNKKKKNKSKS